VDFCKEKINVFRAATIFAKAYTSAKLLPKRVLYGRRFFSLSLLQYKQIDYCPNANKEQT
jgi:hypothetical protein